MSISINIIEQAGNLTRDIELRTTNSGLSVANIGIAVNDRVKKGDNWVDEAIFWDVTLFGKLAERCAKHLVKGDTIFVVGRVQKDTWEQDGAVREKLVIVANSVDFLKWGRDNASGGQEAPEKAPF